MKKDQIGWVPKEYLGAFKRGHRHASKEYIDESLSIELLKRIRESDFTDQEAMDALAYIARFNDEFYKNVVKKGDPKALHKTRKQRHRLYASENARNRDMFTQRLRSVDNLNRKNTIWPDGFEDGRIEGAQANSYLDSKINDNRNLHTQEDTLISLVDKKMNDDEQD